ncbi:ribonuclease G [Evansella caseinilytica]|uniref:Ribonuclease G n=1 Tax=Evansella caseinilytica TaxID=1503961 RepID=A0A1H3PTQ0_9BACI|nr:Rne/Rng family ribonuclease [Evansella caseinilytica]SDZ03789.1 ribonuclease G [Evansella caseinilytica]
MRKIILNMIAEEKRGAVLEDGKVHEWLFEQADEWTRSGNIILGKVMDIVPGMEAAFVDIGGEKNGYLYRNELIRYQAHKDGTAAQNAPSIRTLLTKGQTIIVQVTKEAYGTKGARLTEVVSLPGKYIVYLPHGNYVAVSKKMTSDHTRDEWRRRGKAWLHDNEGMIIRTAAEEMDEQHIFEELERLRAKYSAVAKAAASGQPPQLLFNQSSLIQRVMRDYFSNGEAEIVVDQREEYLSIIQETDRESQHRVQLFQEKEDIFTAYKLDKPLEKSLRRHVWLKNGAFLIIDRTEALTVIDVNTGKYVGNESLRDTVVKTNVEAAYAAAEQIRLRDIGGIILIDFIDMKQEADREHVLSTLKHAVAGDRSLINIAGYTQFGLVEMTRKKNRKSLDQLLLSPCSCCYGTGSVRSTASAVAELEREAYALRFTDDEAILVDVLPPLFHALLNNNQEKRKRIEANAGKKLYLLLSDELEGAGRFHAIRMLGDAHQLKEAWSRRSSGQE